MPERESVVTKETIAALAAMIGDLGVGSKLSLKLAGGVVSI